MIFKNSKILLFGLILSLLSPALSVLGSEPGADVRRQEILDLWDEGKKARAFRQMRKWKGEDSDKASPWIVGAILNYRQGKFKKCLKYSKKALKRAPHNAEAFYWRGKAYEELKKPLEAANEYQAALVAEQEYILAQEGLDRVLAHLSNEK